ncbi:EAL domain-containing protein [Gordonia sp. SL306]|uniref:EAL domain-containing protein n=1 Tax=Gordonia sp. SL306 TaxID=2995145 RepID=UPI002270FE34|nr:EAL domain-containing protein [Gordonia sp. SL306]WAC56751.1 EAL domain-containing protein [Gordonia sp. SL306]
MKRGLAGTTAIAMAADPYHRAAVAYGRAESALIADRFVDEVLRPLSPTANFERRSAFEWLIWLPPTEPGLEGLVSAVRGSLSSRRLEMGGVACFLDICAGVAVSADLPSVATSDALTQFADSALSTAITRQHNVVFADPTTPVRIREDVEIATRLSRSDDNDFVLHYQPIVTLPDRRTVGYESLLRWNTEAGLLSPDAFLSVAEETSLIVPIGRHAIGEAVRALSSEIVPAIGEEAFVAINLSAQQLWDSAIGTYTQELVDTNGVEPGQIWIELSENEAVGLGTPAALAVQQLHEIGCIICVDDLGSGFSALRYVRDLPIGVLKVDKNLVDQIPDDASSRALVHAICDVAQATGVTMVAEGVEDEAIIPELQELGFDFAQGYLFGRPSARIR